MSQDEMWAFYNRLDREVKADFMTEVMEAAEWGKSTFYTRMQDRLHWTKLEEEKVLKIYEKYKALYYDEPSCN